MVKQKPIKRHYPPKGQQAEAPAPPTPPSFARQLAGLIVLALRDFFHWPRGGRPLPETTPLHVASSYGVTELLLKAGADPNALNAHNCTPLNLATGKCAQLLTRYGARPAPPPPVLHTAGLS